MKPILRFQLSLMMFMQFFVWGAWYGQMSKYMTDQLGASGDQVGSAYAAFSIAMIIAPFFVGMLADRYFQAQKVLGVLNILGAAILYVLTTITNADTFYWVMLLYCLTFAPTIALTASISMRTRISMVMCITCTTATRTASATSMWTRPMTIPTAESRRTLTSWW